MGHDYHHDSEPEPYAMSEMTRSLLTVVLCVIYVGLFRFRVHLMRKERPNRDPKP